MIGIERLAKAEEGESIASLTEQRDELAGELATGIDDAKVLCHKMVVDLKELEEQALADFIVAYAK